MSYYSILFSNKKKAAAVASLSEACIAASEYYGDTPMFDELEANGCIGETCPFRQQYGCGACQSAYDMMYRFDHDNGFYSQSFSSAIKSAQSIVDMEMCMGKVLFTLLDLEMSDEMMCANCPLKQCGACTNGKAPEDIVKVLGFLKSSNMFDDDQIQDRLDSYIAEKIG